MMVCGLSLLLAQVAQLTKQNEGLVQEMDRVMTGMEKLKTGKPKKKPSDTDEPSKVGYSYG